jgi:hypothetical protein
MSSDVPAAVKDTQTGLNLLEMLLQSQYDLYVGDYKHSSLLCTGVVPSHMILMMLWMFL